MTVANDQGFPKIQTPIVDPATGTATATFYQWAISLWQRTGGSQNIVGQGVYSGKVDQFAGTADNIPQGWLLCDGSAVDRVTYKSLFRAIGTKWGAGDGTNTFNLPNLQDRLIIGDGNLYSVGQTGGTSQVTLTVGNLPAHNHGINDPGHTHTFTGTPHTHTITDTGHVHTDGTPNGSADVASGADKTSAIAGNTGNAVTGIVINNATAGGTNASATTGITTQNTGSGDAVDILPPYAALTFIIKT